MRPLIEMLEDERTLMQRREAAVRFMEKSFDEDMIDILSARNKKIANDIEAVRVEIKEYFETLLS